MKKILEFKFEGFHQRWLEFQRSAKRTLVLAPRGHGKSTILNVGYTLWRILTDPDERVLVVSATGLQAQGFLREMKAHLEKNPRLIDCYGIRKSDRWRENEFSIAGRRRMAKEATVTAIGVEGAIISRHYDTIILDDVVDQDGSHSPVARDRLEEWFYKILEPCLEPGGRLHLIGTRYHPDDLYGRLIAKARSVQFLN